MKNILVFILLFYIPVLLSAQEKYIKIDLEDTEYLYPAEKAFLKKTGEPLQGNYELKINPYQKEKSTFINGLKNGKTEIYRNKKLSEVGLYHNDLREGEWKYFNRAGDLWKLTYYQNGLREGLEKVYSGAKLTETVNYKLNHQDGLTTKFWYGGELKSKETYQKDKPIDTSYHYTYGNKLEKKCFNGIDTSFCINYHRSTDVKVLDTVFYNSNKKPVLLKAYMNDTLKLKIMMNYEAVVNDAYDRKVVRADVYEDEKLNMTYFFEKPYGDRYKTDEQIRSLLRYRVYHYTKPERIRLTITTPDRDNYDKTTFYKQHPGSKYITRVEYSNRGDGDELGGWYHYDIDR